MFKYIKCRNKLIKVEEFEALLKEYCNLEDEVSEEYSKNNRGFSYFDASVYTLQSIIQDRCKKKFSSKYENLRERIAQQIPSICQIATDVGIDTERLSYPSPVLGGPTVTIDIFDSLLEDHGHMTTSNTTRFDCLNKIIGVLRERKKSCLNSD